MRRTGARRSGFTLLEIVLATALMVPVMSLMFWFYSSTLESRDRSAERVRRTQLARVIVDRIARELRQATGFSGGYGTGIFGTRHRISINTVVIPDKALVERRGLRDAQRPGQFDLRQIDYYIAWDDVNLDENNDPRALGMVRRERKTFNRLSQAEAEALSGEIPDETLEGEDPTQPEQAEEAGQPGAPPDAQAQDTGPTRSALGRSANEAFDKNADKALSDQEQEGSKQELYAPELKFIEFFYHDGTRWWDSWEITEGNSLPQMVMITVGYEPQLPEDEDIKIMKDILDNKEDLKPVPRDRYVTVVRIPQADSFFLGPRIQRELSSLSDLGDVP